MLDPDPVMPATGQRWRSLIDGRTLTIIEAAVTERSELLVRFDDSPAMILIDPDELTFDYEPLPARSDDVNSQQPLGGDTEIDHFDRLDVDPVDGIG